MPFGKNQINKPTPASVENGFKIVSAIAAVIIAWFQTIDFLPSNVVKVVSGILGLIIALSAALVPFFGVSTNETTVPIQEVKSMDNPTK